MAGVVVAVDVVPHLASGVVTAAVLDRLDPPPLHRALARAAR